jgi:tRNA dimethylallyltransferase
VWSLALFQQQAWRAVAAIHARGRLPFLVGGTGQYVRAVTQGWRVPEAQPDPRLRAALENWAAEIGQDGLHARLAALDPAAAAGIDPRNLRRTVRALEVILSTGKLFSSQRRRMVSPYRLLLLGLQRPRPELYARIDARIQFMLAAGFVDEVRSLLKRGYSPGLPTLSAIGYREIIAYLQGKITLEEAVERMQRATRTFVRRQANWFKSSDPEIHWFDVGEGSVDELEKTIREWLGSAGAVSIT